MSRPPRQVSRRQLLKAGAGLSLVMSTPNVAAAVQSSATGSGQTEATPFQSKPDYICNIESKSIAPLGTPTEATLINGSLPGPEIRYREGDMFRVLVNNRLKVPTTLHWHGMIVPN